MAWLTEEVLTRRWSSALLIEVTDDDDDATAIDTDVLDQAINAAASEVKSYLRRRYPTECDAQTASAIVTQLAASLCYQYLCGRREGNSMAAIAEGDTARRALGAIRDGNQDVPEWEATASSSDIPQGDATFYSDSDIPDVLLAEDQD